MKKPAIIVDIDGTIANHIGKEGARSHYDFSKVHLDLPHTDVIELITMLAESGYAIIFVSGRMEQCRDQTAVWIAEHTPFKKFELFMRKDRDQRSDAIVKKEIYHGKIEPHYKIKYVFDDRDRVVEMWRSLGLRCFQVAPGDF